MCLLARSAGAVVRVCRRAARHGTVDAAGIAERSGRGRRGPSGHRRAPTRDDRSSSVPRRRGPRNAHVSVNNCRDCQNVSTHSRDHLRRGRRAPVSAGSEQSARAIPRRSSGVREAGPPAAACASGQMSFRNGLSDPLPVRFVTLLSREFSRTRPHRCRPSGPLTVDRRDDAGTAGVVGRRIAAAQPPACHGPVVERSRSPARDSDRRNRLARRPRPRAAHGRPWGGRVAARTAGGRRPRSPITLARVFLLSPAPSRSRAQAAMLAWMRGECRLIAWPIQRKRLALG
jgi:hypothetical protein